MFFIKQYKHIITFFRASSATKMAGGVFHVEFGINDTVLTRALENKQYSVAETIIRENTNPSYLDEGVFCE